MCIRCDKQCKPKKGKPSQDELWDLYANAYTAFQEEFVTGRKTYRRYVADFISFNLLIDSSDIRSWRLHSMNINRLFDLLSNRKDLVQKYFTRNSLSRREIEMMNHEYDTTDIVVDESKEHENHVESKTSLVLSHFSDHQLSLIVESANEAHLFVTNVSLEEMRMFFSCSLNRPLHVTNNGLVALFLDCLRCEYLIPYNWQKLIAEHRLLCSYRKMKVLNCTDISTSLNEYRHHHPQTMKKFEGLAMKLKDMIVME